MRKSTLLMAALCSLMATSAFAGQKFTANVSGLALVHPARTAAADGWTDVLKGSIHTPNQKDLLIGVSFETSLLTDTLVVSKAGAKDTSTAEASIEIQVLVDGVPADPGTVIYDKRKQQLSATLGGYYTNCVDSNLDGIIDVTTECELAPEEIQLLLDTTAAHHFNFIKADLPSGDHTVVVQSRITNSTGYQNGSASATALVGKGTLSVEEVAASNSVDGIVMQ